MTTEEQLKEALEENRRLKEGLLRNRNHDERLSAFMAKYRAYRQALASVGGPLDEDVLRAAVMELCLPYELELETLTARLNRWREAMREVNVDAYRERKSVLDGEYRELPMPLEQRSRYRGIMPRLRGVARQLGYALAVHGSESRDFDIVAAPWTAEAVTPEELAEGLRKAIGPRATFLADAQGVAWADKPHGRRAVLIMLDHLDFVHGILDLSVMPCLTVAHEDAG